MTALHDPTTELTTELQPQIVDLARFRRAAATRERAGAAPEPADAPPGDSVVVRFADAAQRLRPAPVANGPELLPACEALITSFRTMHEAVIELVVSCRELETAPARKPASTEDVMLGLAILSTATERFQQQLSATIDSAFG